MFIINIPMFPNWYRSTPIFICRELQPQYQKYSVLLMAKPIENAIAHDYSVG